MTNGTSLNGIIYRRQFSSHSNLRAWVQAKNQYGSVNSKKIEFNTGNISESVLSILTHLLWNGLLGQQHGGYRQEEIG